MRPSRNLVTRARHPRKAMTPPELRLWQYLRTRPDGFKFRRQHPLGPYVLDFYCREAGLAIEVDGMAHDMGTNPQRDERRDAWLHGQGVKTLRFAAVHLLNDMDAVTQLIRVECSARSPTPA